MMRREVVQERGWLDDQRFLDLLGATNLIPGPNSTEMTMHIGSLRAGWKGLLVGGACFIAPAMVIVLTLAWAYVEYGTTPAATWLLYGIKPVIIAIVVQAIYGGLLGTAVKGRFWARLALPCMALYFAGFNEIVLLFGAGLLVMLWPRTAAGLRPRARPRSVALPASLPLALPSVNSPPGYSALTLFLTFLKIGAVLYGSGYVLLAFVRNDFVERLGWLTNEQLLDAVAVGQITPGPVFTTATFIGYVVGGFPGANAGDGRHLFALFHLRRADASAGAEVTRARPGPRPPGRRQRRRGRTDGRRDRHTGAQRGRRWGDGRDGTGVGRPTGELQGELSLARGLRGRGRHPLPPGNVIPAEAVRLPLEGRLPAWPRPRMLVCPEGAMPETVESLLAHYRNQRAQLLAAVEGVGAEAMVEPTLDGWSVKDHLGHLAMWDGARADDVERLSAGHATAWRMTDEEDESINDIMHNAWAPLSLEQVRWELARSHQRLLDAIAAAPQSALDASLYGVAYLRSDHDSIHAESIRRWRGERGL